MTSAALRVLPSIDHAVDDAATFRPMPTEPDGCRVLAASVLGGPLTWGEHVELHGELPPIDPAHLIEELAASGLTGRGGAGFPVERKMRAVLAGPGPRVVIANAAEGEPASAKDKRLLGTDPHLCLDGLQVAARVVGADRAYIYVHEDPRLVRIVETALRERRQVLPHEVAVELVTAPARFVSGEESAVVSRVSGGPALPRPKPPRVFESGVDGQPTLVSNVESLAHVALIARQGARTFREVGHPDQPGTMLFTISGGVHRPQVIEAPIGVRLGDLVDRVGGPVEPPSAVLIGGYHGAWVPWTQARDLAMANPVLRTLGLSVGAGVLAVLPSSVCGLRESVRVLQYLADSSAGQCGPCVFGLPKAALALAALVDGGGAKAERRLAGLEQLLERRGGCSHPDGSLRFLRSALTVFADEVDAHAHGGCTHPTGRPVLPTPGTVA